MLEQLAFAALAQSIIPMGPVRDTTPPGAQEAAAAARRPMPQHPSGEFSWGEQDWQKFMAIFMRKFEEAQAAQKAKLRK